MARGNIDKGPEGPNASKKKLANSHSRGAASGAITRADLAEAVHRAVGLPRGQAAAYVEVVLSEISETIIGGEDVKLSSFGLFQVREKKARIGRNPKTGADATIAARRVVVFKASTILRGKINGDERDDD
jgi:integration host factor subunit alpha